MAWVILKEGETATGDDIKDFVRDHMAKHKTPKYVRFVDSFPMNAAGKILKYKMVEQSIDLLGLKEASKIETA
jgi:fatty-acyl-CoA synthase